MGQILDDHVKKKNLFNIVWIVERLDADTREPKAPNQTKPSASVASLGEQGAGTTVEFGPQVRLCIHSAAQRTR